MVSAGAMPAFTLSGTGVVNAVLLLEGERSHFIN